VHEDFFGVAAAQSTGAAEFAFLGNRNGTAALTEFQRRCCSRASAADDHGIEAVFHESSLPVWTSV
jgi:hypothetical protein